MISDPDELTPVEQVGRRWYKRDDLFMPFADVPLSGGKVRQAMRLLSGKRDEIVEQHDGYVLTTSSVHSPQGLIIARVAAELGLRCVIFVGATTTSKALTKHPMLVAALRTGALLDTSAKLGYESALVARVKQWQDARGHGYFVRFGINLEDDPGAIIGSTADQCANLPPDVERVVIPVGAGITAAGIILGLREHRPDARAVCVQISGYDRTPTIDRIVGDFGDYDWHVIRGVPYSKHVDSLVTYGFGLDPIYEAKAYEWMREQRGLDNERVCFWVVGDSRAVRAGTLHAATSSAVEARGRAS